MISPLSPTPTDTSNLTTLLRTYIADEPRRAAGGLMALAGFDFQLRTALADFAVILSTNRLSPEKAGGVFVETLSDFVRCEMDRLVCVQVKRTLTRATLRHAAAELAAIDRFLERRSVAFRNEVRFEVVTSAIAPASLGWSTLFDDAEHGPRLRQLQEAGRLLPPRRVDDPWWKLVSAVFHDLVDPFDFARFALERLLSRAPDPSDAAHARDDIVERYARSRRQDVIAALGHVPKPEDFDPTPDPSRHLIVGRAPTLDLLRDAQYMVRAHPLALARAELERLVELSRPRTVVPRVNLFWMHGRSGTGKSVLLLQLMETLVRDGRHAVWLGSNVEQLEPLLRTCGNVEETRRPEFVFVDDLYDPDARDRLDVLRLGRFIDERGATAWPIVVTCGPPEFVEAFNDACRHHGLQVHEWLLEPVNDAEARTLAVWFQMRTGRRVIPGKAFAQARVNNGLLLSMAVEAAHGDLLQFATRFRARVEAMEGESSREGPGFSEQLRLPLALGRLYIGAPYGWLSRTAREHLDAFNRDGDFAIFDPGLGAPRRYLRLTHPHLSDAIYRALRRPATPVAYANDLGDAFGLALSEGDMPMAARLLRLFATHNRDDLIGQRLEGVDEGTLADCCLSAWRKHLPINSLGGELAAEVATSWACWASANPAISLELGDDLLARAVTALEAATERWADLWLRLWRRNVADPALVGWAARALHDPARMRHTLWSFVWEGVFGADTSGINRAEWVALGERWLATRHAAPDWHFVWRRLVPAGNVSAPPGATRAIELGLERLDTMPDQPEWAFVFQDLLALAERQPQFVSACDLVGRALRWLKGREDRPEWTYVWEAILERPTLLPTDVTSMSLVELGWRWLTGREDRPEWAHVWRALLERPTLLPARVTETSVVESGWRWLNGREDRPEWTHVWRALLERPTLLPSSVTETSVVESGWNWLIGHEERPDWTHVWQKLLEQPKLLPPTVPEASVVESGWHWLTDREDRAEWTYVWEALLERRTVLPHGVTEASIVESGWRWLAGREERRAWTHVWRALLERPTLLPSRVTEASVLLSGWDWLTGREDRPEWTHVWRKLLERPTFLAPSVTVASIVELGRRWLVGREERPEWTHVWEALLERQTLLTSRATETSIMESGWQWLTGHEERPEWSFVWQVLLERPTLLPSSVTEESVIERGCQWLANQAVRDDWPVVWTLLARRSNGLSNDSRDLLTTLGRDWVTDKKNEHSKSFGQVIEGLFDLGSVEPALAAGTSWIDGMSTHPSWPVIAAKAIAAAPSTQAAERWAQSLITKIELEPFRKSLVQTESILLPVVEQDTANPVIHRLVRVLLARPRDLDSQIELLNEFLKSGVPIAAHVAHWGERAAVVFVNGVRARLHCPSDIVLRSGDSILVVVTRVDAARRRVLVRLHPAPTGLLGPSRDRLRRNADETVQVGNIENGRIDNLKSYGVFVEFRGFVGLLHNSRLPTGINPERDFVRGNPIRVRISAIDTRGIQLSPADDQQ